MLHKVLLIIASVIGLTACTNKPNKIQNIILTGNSIKYWDKIYATDIYGRSYSPIDKSHKPMYCDKFEASGRVTHYNYLDSLTIIESGCDSDLIVNPDNFTFESDSILNFGGRNYTVDVISKDIMVLKFGPDKNRIATVIYMTSKLQNKKLVKCN